MLLFQVLLQRTSHVNDTSSKNRAAADKAFTSKTAKYANLCQYHIFMLIAVDIYPVCRINSLMIL